MQFSKSAILATLAGVSSLVYAQESQSSSSSSGTVKVNVVSVGKGGKVFSPSSITAGVGEMVQFQFVGGNHSVVQSTFAKPCVPGPEGGAAAPFFSGYMPVSAGASSMPTFTIMINDTKPIWFYCSQGNHCETGMVGVINVAKDSPNTLDAYKAAAAKVSASEDPTNASSGSSSSSSSGSEGSSGTMTGMTTMATAASTSSASNPAASAAMNGTVGSGSTPAFYSSPSLTVFFAVIAAAVMLI